MDVLHSLALAMVFCALQCDIKLLLRNLILKCKERKQNPLTRTINSEHVGILIGYQMTTEGIITFQG